MRLSSRLAGVIDSPIGAAQALRSERAGDRNLLDLSQAAPGFPPADVVAQRVAEVAHEPEGARYVGQAGLPALREAVAADLSDAYRAPVSEENVLITGGCNQAFCLAMAAVVEPGDAVVLASPFYFNHDMWLRIEGVEVRHLRCAPGGPPDVDDLGRLIDDRCRAVVLVSPGNPTGVTIPPDVIAAFVDRCRSAGLMLVLDETYRSYRGTPEPAHDLFGAGDWPDHLISLHSFSKDLAIPGYRVGALVGHGEIITQACKWLDCVSICTSRIGQEAALAGLRFATEWRDDTAARILRLQGRFEATMAPSPGGFELVSAGAYFGWVRHPFDDRTTEDVVRMLVTEHDVLTIPGTAFTATDERLLRLSFANLEPDQITDLAARLATV